MSILVVHLVPQGILFGADRNITTAITFGGKSTMQGQSQRAKVLKWPNREAIVGYVGAASIDNIPTDDWLYHNFIGQNLTFSSLRPIVESLEQELQAKMSGGTLQDGLILHIGGFEQINGESKPVVWFLRNTRMDAIGEYFLHTSFECSEEISDPKYFGTKSGNEIRRDLEQMVKKGGLFSFRQGFDLGAFNAFDSVVRVALQAIIQSNRHPSPDSLEEWSKHVKATILAYGAYFQSFYEPFEQYVGGGADVVWAKWPNT